MQKNALLLLLLCLHSFAFAQYSKITTTEYIDFWNGDDSKDSLAADFEWTGDVLYKRFFKNTKIVEKEYLKIGKDTFLYVKYDKKKHDVLQEGKMTRMPCCSRIDSVITYNPDTYDEQIQLVKYAKLGKTGNWFEKNDTIVERGTYKNDKRIGEWLSWQRKKYTYYNDDGKILYEEPTNIVDTQDSGQIAHRLLGCWLIQRHTSVLELHNYEALHNSSYSTREYLDFSTKTITYTPFHRCGSVIYAPNPIGTWSLKGDILTITGTSLTCKTYKIEFLSKNELRLKEHKN